MRALLLLACLLPAMLTAGEVDMDQLALEIRRFQQHQLDRFAPNTTAEALQLLAEARDADAEHAEPLLRQAREKFEEAKNTASAFQSRYQPLLDLRNDLNALLELFPDHLKYRNDIIVQHKQQADALLQKAIAHMERGELNISRQEGDEAAVHYKRAIENLLPELADAAKRKLSRAASEGAKRYALHTYATAKQKLQDIYDFMDSRKQRPLPSRPADAYRLAEKAMNLAKKVRQLRRDQASFESVFDEQREFRLKLARTLGLPVDTRDPLVDISNKAVLDGVIDLKRQLEQERIKRQQQLQALNQQHQQEMQRLREELLASSSEQLASMKDAFRAKLERETFEKRRQEKIHKLFKRGEAEILANLDGSVLMRLSSLKFSSGSSKISKKYHDLLKRVKEALDVYADRQVRIEGHTDNRGDVKMNQQLSLRRAEAVRDFLIRQGVDGGRLRSLGYGEVRPIASNEFEKGREMNRRIDIIIEAPHD